MYDFDHDCCAGADNSELPGRCANGFTKTETRSCGHGFSWCDKYGCKEYTCEKSSPCAEYVGWFVDQTEGADFGIKASGFPSTKEYANGFRVAGVVSECSNYCRKHNYAYSAVGGADTCRCGNSYPSNGIASASRCGKLQSKALAMSCGDGHAGTCYGNYAVYRLKGQWLVH